MTTIYWPAMTKPLESMSAILSTGWSAASGERSFPGINSILPICRSRPELTALIGCLADISDCFDVAVLDQYGVLHDGTEPYPFANSAIEFLSAAGKPAAILSNSGRRADLNRERIRQLGVNLSDSCAVETSGEACWNDLKAGLLKVSANNSQALFPIEARPGDARAWALGNSSVNLVAELREADAVLLMGMPPELELDGALSLLEQAISKRLPLICTNPDKLSPSPSGALPSPGSLADKFESLGGRVIWYGKPYPRIFSAVQALFPEADPKRFLMVGDSMEHDIAGASAVGWLTVLVRSGLHNEEFPDSAESAEIMHSFRKLTRLSAGILPDYSMELFR